MKLWIGGEIQADVGDSFREARNLVEKRINASIEAKNYGIELDAWDCTAILRDDNCFKEITKYSKKKRDMDFRLKLDHSKFKECNQRQCERMIYEMLLRSLDILKEKGLEASGLDELKADVVSVAEINNWCEGD